MTRQASAPVLDRDGLAAAVVALRRRDATLDAIVATHGPPPFWRRAPGWRTLVHIILEQQVSLASARAGYARLRAGVNPFTARHLATRTVEQLRALGLTRQKARYCINLAKAVADGRFSAARLQRLDDAAALDALCALDGVGPWTAQCYLLLALRRADVWPDGDLALRNAVAARYGVTRDAERAALVAGWRPWRSVAARLLWHDYLAR